jgi:hypothetical protein
MIGSDHVRREISRTRWSMNPILFLRVASIVTLLYCIGHSSGMPWTPAEGPAGMAVIEAMKSHRFDILGVQRTYWDFYFGFGVIISVYLLVQAVVLWQLASLAKRGTQVRSIVASFLVAFAINAILVWKYFFTIPAIMVMVIALCLLLALLTEGKPRPAGAAPVT